MPNYEELTGTDKANATKWMNELVDAATAEDEAKAKQDDLKKKLAKLMGGPFDAVDINGGKVTGNQITPTVTKDAAKEITDTLPGDVVEALQQTATPITAEALKGLGKHAQADIRAWVGVIEAKIKTWKDAQIVVAQAKNDASDVKISVTARKSAAKS